MSVPNSHQENTNKNYRSDPLLIEPYLHLESSHIYNPLTDKRLDSGLKGYQELTSLLLNQSNVNDLSKALRDSLFEQGWLVSSNIVPSERYYLQYAELETSTYCNQACNFCPVSLSPRSYHTMPLALFESILQQLAEYRQTLRIVMLFRYNEPTVEKTSC